MYGSGVIDIDRPVTYFFNLKIGDKLRFVYPENSSDVQNTYKYLVINKVYTIKYMKYIEKHDLFYLQFEEIGDDVYFNSLQFMLATGYYRVSMFSIKYIKYKLKKWKMKIHKIYNRGYDKL